MRLIRTIILFREGYRMSRACLATIIALLLSACLSAKPPAPTDVLALNHVTIIDGTGAPPQPDMTLVIAAGHLRSIMPTSLRVVPPGARVIDASGEYAIPGLWDMHTHIAAAGWNNTTVAPKREWTSSILIPQLVSYGITGIRDMGGVLDVLEEARSRIRAGEMAGPHMIFSGPYLINQKEGGADSMPVFSAEDARKAVDTLRAQGADFIKVINLDRPAYFAVAAESRKDGLPFVGHVPLAITATEAANAGQRSIEHIFYSNLFLDCASDGDALRKRILQAEAQKDGSALAGLVDEADRNFSAERAAALWQTFRRQGTWIVPTVINLYTWAHWDSLPANDPGLLLVPPAVRRDWAPARLSAGMSAAALDWRKRQARNDVKLIGEMHRAGVPMLAGSDSMDAYVFPGESLHRELAMLVLAGFTPMQALQAATLQPARFLGKQAELGTIEPGKIADVLLLSADPLVDIHNTQKIAGLILGGRYYSQSDLLEMRHKAETAD